MLKIKFLVLLFFLISCKPSSESLLKEGSYSELMTTFKVELLNYKNFNSGKYITRPSGTWQPLIVFHFMGNYGSGYLQKCLIYRIPYKKNIKGALKLIALKKNEKCHEKILLESEETIEGIGNVKAFLLSRRETARRKVNKEIYNFELEFLDAKNKKRVFNLPLYNLTDPNISKFDNQGKRIRKLYRKIFKKFDSSSTQNKLGGVIVLPKGKIHLEFDKKSSFLGSLNDSFLDQTAKRCHKVNNNCETIEKYKCDRCKYGWYEVIGSKCRKVRDKYCGVNRCGEKGWPACVRGFNFSKSRIESGCYAESDSGFCQKGLVTGCDGDQNLICL